MRFRFSPLTLAVALAALLVPAHVFAQCTWAGTSSVLSTTSTCSVGIGTTTPGFPFEVVKDGGNGQLAATAFASTGGAINFLGRGARGSAASPAASQNGDFFMVMGGRGHTGSGFSTANSARIAFRAAENFTPTAVGGFMTFDTTTTGTTTLTERMRLTSDGVLLINQTAPLAPPAGFNNVKLSVNGDITIAGNINAKYQDVAEWVPVAEQMAAGTVVVLNRGKANEVIASSRSYDTAVAGVVSAQPGVTLGEPGDSKETIATTGRVKVRVDASKHAIAVGDLLVTSDVAGVAMRSEPIEVAGRSFHQPGTIIGKALEPLDRGRGEILVLLSLQ